MGLPSGTLWADRVLGAESPQADGKLYSFANTVGHLTGDGYDFTPEAYEATTGYDCNHNMPANALRDAAFAESNGALRVPSRNDFLELLQNTTPSLVSIGDDKYVVRLTSNVNNAHVDIPCETTVEDGDRYSSANIRLWGYREANEQSQDPAMSDIGHIQFVNDSLDETLVDACELYQGVQILPIAVNNPQAVDLGLPSGTLWADRNVGAGSPADAGLFYSWGNVFGHVMSDDVRYTIEDYRNSVGADLDESIYADESYRFIYDAAYNEVSPNFVIPSHAQFEELIQNTRQTVVQIDEDNAVVRFTAPNGNYIDIPATSGVFDTDGWRGGSDASYWSSRIDDEEPNTVATSLDISVGGTVLDDLSVGSSSRFLGLTIRPVVNVE